MSMSGSSVVPGLPKMVSAPSCFKSSRKARLPEMKDIASVRAPSWAPQANRAGRTGCREPCAAPAARAVRRAPGRGRSDLDLDADLDHLRGGHAEIGGRALGIAIEDRENRLAPPRHALAISGDYGFAAEIIRGPLRIDRVDAALGRREPQALRHVRALHEAVVQDHA